MAHRVDTQTVKTSQNEAATVHSKVQVSSAPPTSVQALSNGPIAHAPSNVSVTAYQQPRGLDQRAGGPMRKDPHQGQRFHPYTAVPARPKDSTSVAGAAASDPALRETNDVVQTTPAQTDPNPDTQVTAVQMGRTVLPGQPGSTLPALKQMSPAHVLSGHQYMNMANLLPSQMASQMASQLGFHGMMPNMQSMTNKNHSIGSGPETVDGEHKNGAAGEEAAAATQRSKHQQAGKGGYHSGFASTQSVPYMMGQQTSMGQGASQHQQMMGQQTMMPANAQMTPYLDPSQQQAMQMWLQTDGRAYMNQYEQHAQMLGQSASINWTQAPQYNNTVTAYTTEPAPSRGVTAQDFGDAPRRNMQDTCTLGPTAHAAYQCGYCGITKLSTSAGGDGRVRIRCDCGGRRLDGKPRMHAMWRAIQSEIIIEPKMSQAPGPDQSCMLTARGAVQM